MERLVYVFTVSNTDVIKRGQSDWKDVCTHLSLCMWLGKKWVKLNQTSIFKM